MLGVCVPLVKTVPLWVNSFMRSSRTLAPLLVAVALSVAACSRTPPPARVQAVATVAPPAPRHEERGHAPRSGYVWKGGYWNRVNNQFVWVMGNWSMPPNGFTSWEAPRWIHDPAQGWVLVRGRWR